jgi:flagellin-like protein
MGARGQTEVVGTVLLLAVTVIGVGAVVTAAGGALDSAQDRAAVQRAEQSMSLFDARSALVALGRTDSHSVSLARSGGGADRVDDDAGRMVVIREDADGAQIGDPVVNTTLGAVVYEHGDTEVAYQGGGVWRSTGAGAEMVSPPEFNYRGATLTLPLIRVTGGADAAAGGPTALVTRNEAASNRSVFPGEGRTNPLQDGTVTVAVESDYVRGWASFFRSRTSGNVTVFPDRDRVELELVARGGGGEFSLGETPRDLRGLAASDPMESMTFTLRSKNPGANAFRTLDWELVANEGGSQTFRFHVVNANRGDRPCEGDDPVVTATYEDGGTTHTWTNDSAWEPGSAFRLDCGDDPTIRLDLTGETNLSYEGPAATAPTGNNSVGTIVNYAFAETGPNVDLDVETGTSASVLLDESAGRVEYASSSSRVVTYLHITENAVNVTMR